MLIDIAILVVGDSYADYARFEAGIMQGFAVYGMKARVISVAKPGHSTAKLLRAIRQDVPKLKTLGPFDYAVIVAGVNDVVQRRGAKRYAIDTARLVAMLSHIASSVQIMEIVHFDEYADISRPLGRLKHKFHTFLRDRDDQRIDRYVNAVKKRVEAGFLRTHDLIPSYEPLLFKDGIHLTDFGFRRVASHIGKQLAEIHVGMTQKGNIEGF